MASKNSNFVRQELNLHEAINHALRSVVMREMGILHNVFYLIGNPGIGKTFMIQDACKSMNIGFIGYEPALERVEKFGGIPDMVWIDKEDSPTKETAIGYNNKSLQNKELHTIWSVPQIICEIREVAEKFKNVVVLFDDWHLCTEDIQQIGFELFSYYQLNGHKIPKNVTFILAGNESSAAGARVQLSAIRNRSTVLYTKPDVDYWIENFAIPKGLHEAGVSFFMQTENRALFSEDENINEQFGSPRSWTSLFNNIAIMENLKDCIDSKNEVESKHLLAIAQGEVSKDAASKFVSYYKIYRHIDVNKIFREGEANIPGDQIERFAFGTAVTSAFYEKFIKAKKKEDKEFIAKTFCKIMKKLNEDYKELSVRCIRNLIFKPKVENFPSGKEVFQDLVKNKAMSEKLIQDLSQTINVLGTFK